MPHNNSVELLISQLNTPNHLIHRNYSTDKEIVKSDEKKTDGAVKVISNDSTNDEEIKVPLTAREKLKKTIKDYGATVLVFHIAISIVSLGFFYQLVSRWVETISISLENHCTNDCLVFIRSFMHIIE